MALTQITTQTIVDWLAANRPGYKAGTPYTALVSDLQGESTPGAMDGDFLLGARAMVVSTGATTTGNRTLTLHRLGYEWTTTMVATSQLQISRPR